MIDETQVRRYCREDLSLIENYDEAVRSEEPYHCHHRYELNDGIVLSMNDLKKMGLYFKRPASELIFLKRIDHHRLHTKGNKNYFHNHKFENEKHYRSKPVIQIDKETGEVVGNFLCASTAARHLKIHKSNIHDCCKGKQKTAGGFCWKYAC